MSHEDQIFCGGRISLYEKAKEYVLAIVSDCNDETRIYLHKNLAAYYGLKPSETRHITNEFDELRRRKKVSDGE